MSELIKIGARNNGYSLNQAKTVINIMKSNYPEIEIELVPFNSQGDKLLEKGETTSEKGVFTRELEEALRCGKVDFAVHSMKDIPAEMTDGLILAGILPREDPRDALFVRRDLLRDIKHSDDAAVILSQLPRGSLIGTSTLRRDLQILGLCGDINTRPISGTIAQKITQVENGVYAGVVIEKNALDRRGVFGDNIFCFDTEDIIPAPGQGIIGIQGSIRNSRLMYANTHDFTDDYFCWAAEKEFTLKLSADGFIPLAAHATISNSQMTLKCMAADMEVRKSVKERISGKDYKAKELGLLLASRVEQMINDQLELHRNQNIVV